jgi:hypothetical protein
MIAAARRGAALPDKAAVARRLGLGLDPGQPASPQANGWTRG